MPTRETVSVVKAEKDTGRKTPKRLAVERSQSSPFLNTYSNSANVAISFFDVKISFGDVKRIDEENGTIHIQDFVSVSMSPEHAKALLDLLSKHLDLYEKNYGSLRHPPVADEQ